MSLSKKILPVPDGPSVSQRFGVEHGPGLGASAPLKVGAIGSASSPPALAPCRSPPW
jgi:hypothetical protein